MDHRMCRKYKEGSQMSDKIYRFREWHIPERMMPGIRRYIDQGIYPGDFLTKIFENDLVGALEEADEENLRNIQAYASYLYSKTPINCWGSEQIVKRWIALKRKQNYETPI